jgi:hypothetical protein
MPLPPTRYHPTDYPPKYRPLGYRAGEEPAPESAAPAPTPRRRWRWIALTALLLATIGAHAGIAWADSGSARSAAPAPAAPEEEAGGECGTGPILEDLPGADGGETEGPAGGGAPQSDPGRAPL